MLYAADVTEASLRDRVFVSLAADEPHVDLWWISLDGIYRPRENVAGGPGLLPRPLAQEPGGSIPPEGEILHPKYGIPARCFAYVGDPAHPHTWHLPYELAGGEIDARRLPKAIEAILSNYRGAHVSAIPERAIPDVLVVLARAAWELGRMPGQASEPAAAYVALARALDQMGRLAEIG